MQHDFLHAAPCVEAAACPLADLLAGSLCAPISADDAVDSRAPVAEAVVRTTQLSRTRTATGHRGSSLRVRPAVGIFFGPSSPHRRAGREAGAGIKCGW